MNKQKIPIVFAFDENYALPASVALSSLFASKKEETEYDVFVLHDGLKKNVMQKMEQICQINWIKVDPKKLKDVPTGWSGLATYYRLFVAELIPQYDKIIWSDVDVLFTGDLCEVYQTDLCGIDWAGIAAERQDEQNGIHPHFKENTKEFIYMPGFMLINAKKWRDERKILDFLDTINIYGKRLRFFDLDVLNLSCNKISAIPFNYCVLENIFDAEDITLAPEYPWLSHVYSDADLMDAKSNPVIIHYAGKMPKIWNRPYRDIPGYYWNFIVKSPFYKSADFGVTWISVIRKHLAKILIKICPIKSWRKK